MSDTLAALLLLVHAALMLATAPLVQGVIDRAASLAQGRVGPPLLQPWRELVRLSRKTTLAPSTASPLRQPALLAASSLTVTASLLVPSFCRGMASALLSDLVAVGGLLVAARLALALAALDDGEAPSGLAAGRLLPAAGLLQPGWLLLLAALALATGTTNLDALLAATGELPAGAASLALLALPTLALADSHAGTTALDAFAGADLLVASHAAWLRRLLWLTLLADLIPPAVPLPTSLTALAAGLAAWAIKVPLLAAALGAVQGLARRSALRVPALLGLGALAALLAGCLLIAAQRAA